MIRIRKRYWMKTLCTLQQYAIARHKMKRVMMRKITVLAIALFLLHAGARSLLAQTGPVTRQETLRGSITPEREWWDVQHYHLKVEFLPDTKRLKGSNEIVFKTVKPGSKMQIDLQPPLAITKITHGPSELKFEREGN